MQVHIIIVICSKGASETIVPFFLRLHTRCASDHIFAKETHVNFHEEIPGLEECRRALHAAISDKMARYRTCVLCNTTTSPPRPSFCEYHVTSQASHFQVKIEINTP
jgi:hypothetical protein